jgi:hypothetical protein
MVGPDFSHLVSDRQRATENREEGRVIFREK